MHSLPLVRRRLEAACLAGPLLPADPAAALCPAAELPLLLETAEPRLRLALAEQAGLAVKTVKARELYARMMLRHFPQDAKHDHQSATGL